MKSVHYATASMGYHKKTTFLTISFFFFFSFLLTGLMNLKAIEKELLQQLSRLKSISIHAGYYQQLINQYQAIYFYILLFFVLTFFLLMLYTLSSKKEELRKWQLMGFSTGYILKQLLLEVVISASIAVSSFLLFTLLFQETYESILWQFRLWLANHLNIQELPFFTLNSATTIEATPAKAVTGSAIKTLDFFNFGVDGLTYSTTVKDCLFSNCLLFLLALLIIIPLALLYIHKEKKNRRFL